MFNTPSLDDNVPTVVLPTRTVSCLGLLNVPHIFCFDDLTVVCINVLDCQRFPLDLVVLGIQCADLASELTLCYSGHLACAPPWPDIWHVLHLGCLRDVPVIETL